MRPDTTRAELKAIVIDMLGYAHAKLSLECLARVRIWLPGVDGGPEEIADQFSQAFWDRPEPHALLTFVGDHKAELCTPAVIGAWQESIEAVQALVEAWCHANLTSALEVATRARRESSP